jgi:eukaryotic-like serine/threonine-protein kinase
MKPIDGSFDETLVANDTIADPPVRPSASRLAPAGYQLGEVIGRGGMGEVLLAEDRRIGRKVALKRMRASEPTDEALARFLREARIQARLDHPAIVPVHELGYDDEGRPYFTMKRLAGTTLQVTLADPAANEKAMLRAFVDVCLAIELAHSQRVVHRDLKPSNIVLGNYGEVYVLDWGIARVVDERIGGSGGAGAPGDIVTLDGQTQAGALLGTPGFMAPEQVRGDDDVGPPADVYALGCILFEILTRTPLHPGGQAGLTMTLATPQVAPTTRAPERNIAPELDGACTDALAEDPAARPSARVLADRIQAYLDGDRDVAHRRELAGKLLDTARDAVASGDPARRAEAMRAAGRALALDPESEQAAAIVMQLVLEPPKELPPALEAQIAASDGELVFRHGRSAMFAVGSYLLFFPLAIWVGITEWWFAVAATVIVGGIIGGAIYTMQRRNRRILWAVFGNALLMLLLSRVLSPLVFLPGLASATCVALVTFPTLMDRKWIVIGAMASTVILPLVLEALGVWEKTWDLSGGKFTAWSTVMRFEGVPALVFLIGASVAMVVGMGIFARSLAESRRVANRQLEIQAWHLGQLLPVETPRPSTAKDRLLALC